MEELCTLEDRIGFDACDAVGSEFGQELLQNICSLSC